MSVGDGLDGYEELLVIGPFFGVFVHAVHDEIAERV